MRHQPEQALQRQVANYLAWALCPPAWFTAIPSGGGGEMRGMILKGMGLKAGVPDLLLLHQSRSLWIELKSPRGALSEAQRRCHEAINNAGCRPVVVCRSLDDVQAALAFWGIPTRETKPSLDRIRRGIATAGDGPVAWPDDQLGGRRAWSSRRRRSS